MAWKKVHEDLSEFLETKIAGFSCEKRRMFGCPVCFVNDNMFAGVHQDTIMLRLSENDLAEIFGTHDEAAPFEPLPGRKMREYVSLPETVFGDDTMFDTWLQRSFDYAASLPRKMVKRKK